MMADRPVRFVAAFKTGGFAADDLPIMAFFLKTKG
jgi:hypothetical protein